MQLQGAATGGMTDWLDDTQRVNSARNLWECSPGFFVVLCVSLQYLSHLHLYLWFYVIVQIHSPMSSEKRTKVHWCWWKVRHWLPRGNHYHLDTTGDTKKVFFFVDVFDEVRDSANYVMGRDFLLAENQYKPHLYFSSILWRFVA